MVGRLLSFWEAIVSGPMLVSGRISLLFYLHIHGHEFLPTVRACNTMLWFLLNQVNIQQLKQLLGNTIQTTSTPFLMAYSIWLRTKPVCEDVNPELHAKHLASKTTSEGLVQETPRKPRGFKNKAFKAWKGRFCTGTPLRHSWMSTKQMEMRRTSRITTFYKAICERISKRKPKAENSWKLRELTMYREICVYESVCIYIYIQ